MKQHFNVQISLFPKKDFLCQISRSQCNRSSLKVLLKLLKGLEKYLRKILARVQESMSNKAKPQYKCISSPSHYVSTAQMMVQQRAPN